MGGRKKKGGDGCKKEDNMIEKDGEWRRGEFGGEKKKEILREKTLRIELKESAWAVWGM